MEKDNEESNIDIRSDEMQEVLTKPPHSLIRYGSGVMCAVFLILLAGSFVFTYPDTINGDVVVTADNPPVWSVSHVSERIKRIFVSSGDYVEKGEILAVMDNSASTDDVLCVEKALSQVRIHPDVYIPQTMLADSFALGDVYPSYSEFQRNVVMYQNFISLNLIDKEMASLEKQKTGKIEYIKHLKEQLQLKSQHLHIVNHVYEREKYLFEKALISSADMEKAEMTLLEEKVAEQSLRTSISLENVELSKLQESTGKLSYQYAQEYNQIVQQLLSSYNALCVAVKQWRQNYLIEATDSGVVTFNSVWSENQFVKSGTQIFAVVPSNTSSFTGKIQVPLHGSGKIKKGQDVLITCDAFPYLEYGYIEGKVESISMIPDNNFYTVDVRFPQQLRFTSGEMVDFNGEIHGVAKVITEKRSVISRLISPIFYLISDYL